MIHDVCAEIWQELAERNWTPNDLASAMGPDEEFGRNRLTLDLLFAVDDPRAHMGEETAAALGRAFDRPAEEFLRLEQAPPFHVEESPMPEVQGAAKTTARDDGASWWVQEWDTMVMDDTTYWRTTWGYRLDKAVVRRLYEAQMTKGH